MEIRRIVNVVFVDPDGEVEGMESFIINGKNGSRQMAKVRKVFKDFIKNEEPDVTEDDLEDYYSEGKYMRGRTGVFIVYSKPHK